MESKDIGYYQQMLTDSGIDNTIAKGAIEEMSAAIEAGMGDEMVAKMIDHFKAR